MRHLTCEVVEQQASTVWKQAKVVGDDPGRPKADSSAYLKRGDCKFRSQPI